MLSTERGERLFWLKGVRDCSERKWKCNVPENKVVVYRKCVRDCSDPKDTTHRKVWEVVLTKRCERVFWPWRCCLQKSVRGCLRENENIMILRIKMLSTERCERLFWQWGCCLQIPWGFMGWSKVAPYSTAFVSYHQMKMLRLRLFWPWRLLQKGVRGCSD